jgi:hypothetical protein
MEIFSEQVSKLRNLRTTIKQCATCRRATTTIQNMQVYQYLLQILMRTFRILGFRNVSLVGRFVVLPLSPPELERWFPGRTFPDPVTVLTEVFQLHGQ